MKTRCICLLILTLFYSKFSNAQDFLDTTFDPGTGVNGFVECVVVQPDGKVLIAGNFTSFNGVPRSYMARLNANGSLDTNFVASPNYWVRSMALQSDGKIVIGGFFTSVDGLPRNRVGRVNADGSVDTTFNPGAGCEGRIVPADPTDPFLFAVALQNDGKIIIGGNFTNYNKTTRVGVARLNPDGSLDSNFNVGSGVDSWVRSILVLPNQQIMLSGWFENYNSRGHDRMVRLNPDGSSDESFKTRIGYSTAIYSMSLQSDGKLVVGGHSASTNSPFTQEIVRLNTDGSYDLSFNLGGEGSDEKVESVVVLPDGKILIGGYFSLYNGTRVKSIARLNADGTLDTEFNSSANNWVWSIALQPDGKFLIGGAFSSVNGVSRNGIARLNPTDDPPPVIDQTPPTVSITSPAENELEVFETRLTGTADDDVGVTQVFYRIGTNEFIAAEGTTNWFADVSLQAGNNTVTVKSVDAAGNESEPVSRTFHYMTGTRLQLVVSGPGTTTLTNGQVLEVGKSYTIKAKPIGPHPFRGWTGSVTSSAPTLNFVMSSNFVLQANFATNQFTPAMGSYNGLFSSSNVAPATAGFFSLNVKDSGAFSGTILLEGARSRFSGQLAADGSAQKTISRRRKPALELNLQLDFAGGLTGTVTQNGETSMLVAERAQWADNLPTTKYTLLIPPGLDPSTSPGGYGYGSATVDRKGRIKFKGALADRTTIQQSVPLSLNGRWPFYASLYRGKGVLLGWLTFTNLPDSDLSGDDVAWVKLPGAPGKFYTNGFSLAGPVVGSLYVPPVRNSPPVTWTSAQLELGGGNLAQTMTNTVTLERNRNFAIASTNKTVLKLARSSGLLNGSFVHPQTRRRTPIKGALIQKQQSGAGAFSGSSEIGFFILQTTP